MVHVQFLLISVCISLHIAVSAQNLVANPSFEDFVTCPGYYSQSADEFRVRHWFSANTGTPDHFHACSNGRAGVPHNWAGVAEAYDGDGYVGIYCWMDNHNQYREYLQTMLREPLVKDSTYILQFHYRLSSYSSYAVNRMGLSLSDAAIAIKHDQAMRIKPVLEIIRDTALTYETGLWERARLEYKAKGGERFLSIGNFASNEDTRFYKIKFPVGEEAMLVRSAYYYIDDVSVAAKYQPLRDSIRHHVIPVFFKGDVTLNKRYVLDDIRFEFDSYKLSSSSFHALDEVVEWLREHPYHKVILSGHTDDKGNDQYNLSLSKQRARSVATYLTSQGIALSRIEHYGYGKTRPLLKGTSDDVRSINRRVEIQFIR